MKKVKIYIICNLMALSPFIATGQNTAIKTIEPTLGYTPDISINAAKNLERNRKAYASVDSIINSYPNYEAALKHLTKKQIEIYQNEEEYLKEDHLEVGSWGCSWYCGGGPDSIFSSSELKPINGLDYKPKNAHDFSLRTAWVEGVNGYGIGQSITYRFGKMSPPVTTIEIYNGYMKSDKAWKNNSRVKQLKLYINNKPYALLNLKDTTAKQSFSITSQQGQKSPLFLKFEIVDVYKGDKYDDVAIAEIEFDGTGVHCFSKGTMISCPNKLAQIETLEVGDSVLSFNSLTNKIEKSIIIELARQMHHNLYDLDFDGTIIRVTDDHPFYVDGEFYSININSKYGFSTKELVVGQTVSVLVNGELKKTKLTDITKTDSCEETFTIVKLDKNRLFFANGICVATEELLYFAKLSE